MPGGSLGRLVRRACVPAFSPPLLRPAAGEKAAAMNIATWLLLAYFAMLGNTLFHLFFPGTCGAMESMQACVYPHIADGEKQRAEKQPSHPRFENIFFFAFLLRRRPRHQHAVIPMRAVLQVTGSTSLRTRHQILSIGSITELATALSWSSLRRMCGELHP